MKEMQLRFYDCGDEQCRPFDPCRGCAYILDIQKKHSNTSSCGAKYVSTPYWIEVRSWVLEKYGKQCANINCQSTEKPTIHHVNYPGFQREALHDLICVCDACHKRIHAWEPYPSNGKTDYSAYRYSPLAKWWQIPSEHCCIFVTPGLVNIPEGERQSACGVHGNRRENKQYVSHQFATGNKKTRWLASELVYGATPQAYLQDKMNHHRCTVRFEIANANYITVTAYQQDAVRLREVVSTYRRVQGVGLSFYFRGERMDYVEDWRCSVHDDISMRLIELEAIDEHGVHQSVIQR